MKRMSNAASIKKNGESERKVFLFKKGVNKITIKFERKYREEDEFGKIG